MRQAGVSADQTIAGPSFAIVGVNDGTIGGFNSCFAAEAAWAGPALSVYIILQPAPGGTPVTNEATGPEASCAATSSECEGLDWGYNYARADIAFVRAQGLSPRILVAGRRDLGGLAHGLSVPARERGHRPGRLDCHQAGGRLRRDLLHVVPVGPDNRLLHAHRARLYGWRARGRSAGAITAPGRTASAP